MRATPGGRVRLFGARGGFTPLALKPVLSLRADMGVNSLTGVGADNDPLVTWYDQSGYGNNASQGTAGNRPVVKTGIANGFPVIRFDGTDDYLTIAHHATLALVSDFTFYAVINPTDFLAYRGLLSKDVAGGPKPFDTYLVTAGPDGGKPRLYLGDGNPLDSLTATSAVTAGVPNIIGMSMTGTTAYHRLNGADNGTAVLTAARVDSGLSVYLGTRTDLFTRFFGDWLELLVLDRALTTTEMARLDRYYASKYAITLA